VRVTFVRLLARINTVARRKRTSAYLPTATTQRLLSCALPPELSPFLQTDSVGAVLSTCHLNWFYPLALNSVQAKACGMGGSCTPACRKRPWRSAVPRCTVCHSAATAKGGVDISDVVSVGGDGLLFRRRGGCGILPAYPAVCCAGLLPQRQPLYLAGSSFSISAGALMCRKTCNLSTPWYMSANVPIGRTREGRRNGVVAVGDARDGTTL